MKPWAGLALALRGPGEDGLRSRLPTYMHPLAGRGLSWHVLRALAEPRPEPTQRLLVSAQPLEPAIIAEPSTEIIEVRPDDWWTPVDRRLGPEIEHLLVLDAAAATIDASLTRLIEEEPGHSLLGEDDEPIAVWIERGELTRRAAAHGAADGTVLDVTELARGLEPVVADPGEHAFLVRDRAGIARAARVIRDRTVRRLMDDGVTFLLPETVLIDVQVQIGPDTVIYPSVVLEGETTIGAETVIGPGCRIIDSWIGSGVELKGWNYIANTSLRNRAVLEPNVRRGFD